MLERNEILLTNREYRQIYSAYSHPDRYIDRDDPYKKEAKPLKSVITHPGFPVFITSDSILNAYHVLLEESLVQLETKRFSQLTEALKMILKKMESPRLIVHDRPELTTAANRRARLVIGIAVRLLDRDHRLGEAELDDVVSNETKLNEEARGRRLPEWLRKPSKSLSSIDYERFGPRGFYTRNTKLKRYFRAVSWLQTIPFRVEVDEELLAILMVGDALRVHPEEIDDEGEIVFGTFESLPEIQASQAVETFHYFHAFVGEPDLPDVLVAFEEANLLSSRTDEIDDQEDGKLKLSHKDLLMCRERLQTEIPSRGLEARINDQNRVPPVDPAKVDDLQFRVISASRTPDAQLFQRTTDLLPLNRYFPDSLELVIGLGSKSARAYLNDPHKNKVLQVIDDSMPLFKAENEGKNLYYSWLNVLKALLDEPESDAPAFMRSDAWQRKSCNTVLASWAQLRHTMVLYAKANVGSGGFSAPPPGFVEPDPEFFSRMATLVSWTIHVLNANGDLLPTQADYRPLVPTLESLKGMANGISDSKMMKYKIEEPEDISRMADILKSEIEQLVADETESTISDREKWNRAVDQWLSPAKCKEIRELAEGIVDSKAMVKKIKPLRESDGSFGEILLDVLTRLTKKHPEQTLSWGDRWKLVCNQSLPKVADSLKRMAEEKTNEESLKTNIETATEGDNRDYSTELTYLVLKLSSLSTDKNKSYSDDWNRVIDELIQQIQNESSEKHPDLKALMNAEEYDLRNVWRYLFNTTRQLEVIAHKQLRGVDLNKGEISFIKFYDETLASLMLRSKYDPKDDVPRAIGVYTNFQLNQTLHATISRPRALFVLYPWRGKKILARGAVLPYREVITSSPLADKDWKQQLDSGSAPPLPDWL
ncbi:MAG: DUF3160 domain-containing protein, partial [Planctomycetes bacterium]|nr:DUF3160 domain-containing protein [Planctomycetota bacterium]